MKKTYAIPIRIEIDDENPDQRAKATAERIYDAVRELADEMDQSGVRFFDMEYSIYVKPDAATFGT